MKAISKITIVMATILNGCITHVFAQTNNCAAYWVVEGNIYQPNYTLIRFYTSEHVLIQEERLSGIFLDIRKRKNRDFLDRKLNELTCPKMEDIVLHYRKRNGFQKPYSGRSRRT